MRDPVFLAACLSYAINRWILKPRLHSPFLQNWLNDLLLAPCAFPVLFWLFRVLKVRPESSPPSAWEMVWILTVWSLLFEWIGPKFLPWTTGDWRDVVMYWAGGLAAWLYWRRFPRLAFAAEAAQ